GQVDFTRSAREIYNRWRGFQPWPGASSQFRGKSLKIVAARVAEGKAASPGELRWDAEKLIAGCGGGSVLELLQLQPEGRKAISAREFLSGYRPGEGERLGETNLTADLRG